MMNKKLVTILNLLKSVLAGLSLVSTNALAHPGHLPNLYVQEAHSFLHIEHVVAIIATLAVFCGIILIRGK